MLHEALDAWALFEWRRRQKQGPAHLLPNERGLFNGTANPVWEHLG
jgi:hypothetical protein